MRCSTIATDWCPGIIFLPQALWAHMLVCVMGFTALAATAAAVPQLMQATASIQQSRALSKTASAQKKLANRQAAAMENTAAANQRRAARNAEERMSQARADAAAGNLLSEGSVAVRERDLATRLQDEITANANAALQQATDVRQQGELNAWQTRQAARQSMVQGVGAAVGSIGSLFGNISSSLNKS